MLLWFARRLVGNNDAEDVVNEVCAKFTVQVRAGAVTDSGLSAYLKRMCFHQATPFLRRARALRRAREVYEDAIEIGDWPGRSDSPEEAAMLLEEFAALSAISAELSTIDRIVLEGIAEGDSVEETLTRLQAAGAPPSDCTRERVDQRRNAVRHRLRSGK